MDWTSFGSQQELVFSSVFLASAKMKAIVLIHCMHHHIVMMVVVIIIELIMIQMIMIDMIDHD